MVSFLGDNWSAPDGTTFTGWLGSDGQIYQPNDTIQLSGDVTLTAQYKTDGAVTPEPAAVEVTVVGSKKLSGGGKTTADITASQFGFTVKRTDNETGTVTGLPAGTIYAAAGTGALDFGKWSFSNAGIYTFTVSENDVGAGYTKAADVFMTITVTLNDQTKQLETTTSYKTDAGADTALTFANTLMPPVQIARKVLMGKTLEAMEFTFDVTPLYQISSTGAGVAYKVGIYEPFSLQNAADGSISLPADIFQKLYDMKAATGEQYYYNGSTTPDSVYNGTYRFLITEKQEGREGYTYSTASYVAEVTFISNSSTPVMIIAMDPHFDSESGTYRPSAATDLLWAEYDAGYSWFLQDGHGQLYNGAQTGYALFENTYNTTTSPSNPSAHPNTGDNSSMLFWIMLMPLSGLGFGGIRMAGRKKSKHKQ